MTTAAGGVCVTAVENVPAMIRQRGRTPTMGAVTWFRTWQETLRRGAWSPERVPRYDNWRTLAPWPQGIREYLASSLRTQGIKRNVSRHTLPQAVERALVTTGVRLGAGKAMMGWVGARLNGEEEPRFSESGDAPLSWSAATPHRPQRAGTMAWQGIWRRHLLVLAAPRARVIRQSKQVPAVQTWSLVARGRSTIRAPIDSAPRPLRP